MTGMRLEVHGLTVDRGRTRAAVDGVELCVEAGKICFVLGPNGSGKSSLLRAVAALDRARTGRVLLADKPLLAMRPRERARHVTWMAQGAGAPGRLTVYELVASARYARLGAFAGLSGEDRAAIEQALRDVDLDGYAARHVGDLSGGELERALLARSFAQATPLLLLDEPSAALDPVHRLAFARLLRASVDRHRSIALVTTHDLNLAAQCADQVILLESGRLRASGSVQEVFASDALTQLYGSKLVRGARWSDIAQEERPWLLAWE